MQDETTPATRSTRILLASPLQNEGTDTGHHEKVEIHILNCLTRAVTQRARH